MPKSTFLAILIVALPTTFAEDSAVRFKTFYTGFKCETGIADSIFHVKDGNCYSFPGSRMDLLIVADTCQIFIYYNNDCTGDEKQVCKRQTCADIGHFLTIKAFYLKAL